MSKVKLGEVAIEHKETCKGSKDGYPIVGLEHLVPEEVTLTAWDEGSDNTFTKMFRKGNVLFGRRRAYLKKAAVAPFDGICSGDITVIEAKPDHILPELLPFIIQNDALFDFAVSKSAGSLSPRVKWEHLKNYEFGLPDMDKQREIAELLWAMDATRKSYQKLIAATDELVKSQFIEWFGTPFSNPMRWPVCPLSEVISAIVSGECLNGEQRPLKPGELAVLKVSAVTYGYFKDDEYKVVLNPGKIKKNVWPKAGDLLFSRANTREYVGATALVEKDYPALLLPDKLWKLIPADRVTTLFLKYYLSTHEVRSVLSEMATGTSGSMYNISMEKLQGLRIFLPPLVLQNQFTSFVHQTDKSKFELEQALSELTATYKRIITENFG